MYSVFMDNYRGFSSTLLPLGSASFLVGENSTGKSSVLSLLTMFAEHSFWGNGKLPTGPGCDLGGFGDIVSVCSADKRRFTVGALYSRGGREGDAGPDWAFTLITFANDQGIPAVSRYVRFSNDRLVKFRLGTGTAFYKEETVSHVCNAPYETVAGLVQDVARALPEDSRGYRRLPSKTPMPYRTLPLLLSYPGSKNKEPLVDFNSAFGLDQPICTRFSSLAPIRTKPKRIYPSIRVGFTPEGDHTPYVIRTALSPRAKQLDTVGLLREFGTTSGLFRSVNAHTFGKGPDAPFEVCVELWDTPLSISNVGYGVSQALPVVMDMLTRPRGHWLVVQQPEVHLHPKAQAALGQLVHQMVVLKGHHYVIETHSDYLIDRFRLAVRKEGKPDDGQVLFFERTESGNACHVLPLDTKGQYPEDQPASFRDFFIDEQLQLLGV